MSVIAPKHIQYTQLPGAPTEVASVTSSRHSLMLHTQNSSSARYRSVSASR